MKKFKKILEYLVYLLVFLLPWQLKLILRPDTSNYNEISLYAWELVLLLVVAMFFIFSVRPIKKLSIVPMYVWALAGIILFTFISVWRAPDYLLALNYFVLVSLGISLFFLIKSNRFQIPHSNLSWAFLASLLLQSVLALAQFLSQRTWANKYFGLASHDPATTGTAVVEAIGGRWLRAYGGFDHPNILGGVLVFGLILAAHYIISAKRGSEASDTEKKEQWPSLLFSWLFYLTALCALFFSFSRAAWLAYAVVIFFWALFYLQKRAWPNFGKLLALTIISLFLVSIISLPFSDLLKGRLEAVGRLEQKSLSERELYLGQATEMIKADFWWGVGRGNYIKSLPGSDDYPQPVHNVFVLSWAETGIFGFLSFCLFLLYAIKKIPNRGVSLGFFLALIILMFFDHWLFSLPFGLVFFWLIFGFIW